MLYLATSLVTFKEVFYWQNDWLMVNLDMIGLTITSVISRNQKDVVIVLKIHENVAWSMVLEFMTIIFKSGIVLCGIV